MEVKQGYKQTDIGIIPQEWEVKTFEDYADKKVRWSITGGPFGSNLKASDYTSDGVRIIQLQNIGEGKFNDDYKIYTSEEKANELLSCNIYPNEIILSKMGDPVARACFIPNKEGRYIMSSDGIRLVVDEANFSKDFVHIYINSKYFRDRALELSIGSTRKRIGLPDLKKLPVITPSVSEQKAIAQALSDTDALITALEALIDKKRLIKQGTMQQLLTGKKRLEGFSGEWEVKKLEEILINTRLGGNYPNQELNSDYPLIKMGNIARGFIDLNKLEYIKNGLKPLEEDRLQKGDVLFNTRNTLELVGKVAIWNNELPLAYFNSNLMRLDFNPKYVGSNTFMNYLLNTRNVLIQLKGFAIGTTSVAAIYTRDLIKLELTIPSVSEQKAIAEILSDMDNEIATLEAKRHKYKQLKQGMMQELLTGKTRLI